MDVSVLKAVEESFITHQRALILERGIFQGPHPTPEEDAELKRIWAFLPGNTSRATVLDLLCRTL